MNTPERSSRRPVLPADFEHRLAWWKEALIITLFYSTYTLIRNQFGSTLVKGVEVPEHAFDKCRAKLIANQRVGRIKHRDDQGFFPPRQAVFEVSGQNWAATNFFGSVYRFVSHTKTLRAPGKNA